MTKVDLFFAAILCTLATAGALTAWAYTGSPRRNERVALYVSVAIYLGVVVAVLVGVAVA